MSIKLLQICLISCNKCKPKSYFFWLTDVQRVNTSCPFPFILYIPKLYKNTSILVSFTYYQLGNIFSFRGTFSVLKLEPYPSVELNLLEIHSTLALSKYKYFLLWQVPFWIFLIWYCPSTYQEILPHFKSRVSTKFVSFLHPLQTIVV